MGATETRPGGTATVAYVLALHENFEESMRARASGVTWEEGKQPSQGYVWRLNEKPYRIIVTSAVLPPRL